MSAKPTAAEKRDAKKTFTELASRGQPKPTRAEQSNVEVKITRNDGTVETITGHLARVSTTHEREGMSRCELEMDVETHTVTA